MPYHEDLKPTLKALTDTAIDECIRAQKATNFRFPMLLVTGPGGTSISVCAAVVDEPKTEGEVALSFARANVKARARELDAYVIAYDGLLKSKDGGNLEAFILECGEKPQAEAFVFFQRYKIADDGELVLVFGSTSFLRRTEQLLK